MTGNSFRAAGTIRASVEQEGDCPVRAIVETIRPDGSRQAVSVSFPKSLAKYAEEGTRLLVVGRCECGRPGSGYVNDLVAEAVCVRSKGGGSVWIPA